MVTAIRDSAPPGQRTKTAVGWPARPITWTGTQWAVTAFGLEARDGTYAIEKSRLWEDEEMGGWFLHMSEKRWVDLRDFAHALAVARVEFCGLFWPPTYPAPSSTVNTPRLR